MDGEKYTGLQMFAGVVLLLFLLAFMLGFFGFTFRVMYECVMLGWRLL